MKVTLLVVGKTTDPHIVALIDDYKRRLTHYLPFEMVVIPELKNAKNLTEEQQKIVKEAVPQNISEAEPKDVTKK